jgi:2-methylcitrate dehydratase
MAATLAALLAGHGITGPEAVFEGNKGFKETIAGPFEIDWSKEDLERVRLTIVKKHNAEIHAQSALDAALDIRARQEFLAAAVRAVRLKTFEVAHQIIGGGEEGDKRIVRTKEEADHSLPYILAVAILDRQVMPEQYEHERIQRADVQALLGKVSVQPRQLFSERFPDEMPCRVKVTLKDGRVFEQETKDYEGFYTRPMSWEQAVEKFNKVASPNATAVQRVTIAEAVANLEEVSVRELMKQLGAVVPGSESSRVVRPN